MRINFLAATLISLIFFLVSIKRYEEEKWWFHFFYSAYAWFVGQALTYIPFVITEWVLGIKIWESL